MAKNQEKPVRVRFAPSPTGHFHIGGARTALFNWLFAKQHGGEFILRIEDTDKERSKPEYEAEVFDSLSWLGLAWDEGPDKEGAHGPYRQSERSDIYEKYLERLLREGKAYFCYCTKEELEAQKQSLTAQGLPPKYAGHCRDLAEAPSGKSPQVIRLKTPDAPVPFKDMIRGSVSFDASLFGDFVIAKDVRTPLYNFAVVVDDFEMLITHVIRGEDHISNTPKQILIARALEFESPIFAHLPLILAANRSKLSKRYAETSLTDYRSKGYLPEAIVNFLVLLGWHPKDDREVFGLGELIETFDIKRVQKAGAVWNEEKLNWLNREHIKRLGVEELEARLLPLAEKHGIAIGSQERFHRIVAAEQERIKTLEDFFVSSAFFFELPEYQPRLLLWNKNGIPETIESLQGAHATFFDAAAFERSELLSSLAPLTEAKGKGSVFWPLRVALSGKEASPDPLEIAEALGKEEVLRRISLAIKKLENEQKGNAKLDF